MAFREKMKNPWVKEKASDKLRELVGEKDFYGGRFPPDGQWFSTGRRIEPCSVCGCESVTFVQEVDENSPHRLCKRGGQCIWLCEKHEKEYYYLWRDNHVRRNQRSVS